MLSSASTAVRGDGTLFLGQDLCCDCLVRQFVVTFVDLPERASAQKIVHVYYVVFQLLSTHVGINYNLGFVTVILVQYNVSILVGSNSVENYTVRKI